MKRIPLITITPTIKVQILCAMACLKALSNPHLPKKFQKIHLQIGIRAVCPYPPNSIYGSHSPLGVKSYGILKISTLLRVGSQPLSMQQFMPKTAKVCP
jgi:hypothetical protein